MRSVVPITSSALSTTAMTEEKLRAYLFSSARIPHWNGDPSKVVFGVETEYFVHKKNDPLKLMGEADARLFFSRLERKPGFTNHSQHDYEKGISLSRESDDGYTKVKLDFAFHILEVAYPPLRSPDAIRETVGSLVATIDELLSQMGYERSNLAILPSSRAHYELVPIPRLQNYLKQFPAKTPQRPKFYYPDYPAFIAATQVHLNILDESIFSMLPALYELEWLAIRLFSKSHTIDRNAAACARVLMYEQSLGQEYLLKTVPLRIPSSVLEYVDLYNRSEQYFPKDPFFAVRDYTFLRPRPYGSVEFRSTCSQWSTDDLLKVCSFRLLQLLYGKAYRHAPIHSKNDWQRDSMLKHATKIVTSLDRREVAVMERIQRILSDVPEQWRALLPSTLLLGGEP